MDVDTRIQITIKLPGYVCSLPQLWQQTRQDHQQTLGSCFQVFKVADICSNMSVQPEIKVILYSNVNFTGDCVPVHADIPELKNFKDRAESAIVVSGKWELQSAAGGTYPVDDTVGRYADLGTFKQKAISITRV